MTVEVEVEPAVARQIFGDRIELARRYADLLVRDGDMLGLLGPRELPKLWSRHILNSAVVSDAIHKGENVADIGSGAGLPGIPMAIRMPEAHFTLIEPMERRADWLKQAIEGLALENVTVTRARAEEVAPKQFDVVTSRALAALPKLLKMAVPLAKSGGRIVSLKGQKAAEEIAEATKLHKKLGIRSSTVRYTGTDLLAEPTLVVETQLL